MKREYLQNPPENLTRALADRRRFGTSENARGTKKPRFAVFSRRKTDILQNLNAWLQWEDSNSRILQLFGNGT